MKTLTKKQRAAIYLDAARMECDENKTGLNYLWFIKKDFGFGLFCDFYEELELFQEHNSIKGMSKSERSELVTLALLFAYQMCQNK